MSCTAGDSCSGRLSWPETEAAGSIQYLLPVQPCIFSSAPAPSSAGFPAQLLPAAQGRSRSREALGLPSIFVSARENGSSVKIPPSGACPWEVEETVVWRRARQEAGAGRRNLSTAAAVSVWVGLPTQLLLAVWGRFKSALGLGSTFGSVMDTIAPNSSQLEWLHSRFIDKALFSPMLNGEKPLLLESSKDSSLLDSGVTSTHQNLYWPKIKHKCSC